MAKADLTAQRLRELLVYNIESGVFTRRVAVGRHGCHKAGTAAGWFDNNGYINIVVDGGRYKAHRLAWFWVHGTWPANDIDHINRIKSDNRIANLREVSDSENLQNTSLMSNNTSGYRGVYFNKHAGKWQAYINVERKRHHLGLHESAEAASAAYKAAAARLHTHNPLIQVTDS